MEQLIAMIRSGYLSRLVSQMALFVCLSFGPAAAIAAQQAIIIDSGSRFHQSVIESIQHNLNQSDAKLKIISPDDAKNTNLGNSLIISIGRSNTELATPTNPELIVTTTIAPTASPDKKNTHYLSMTHSACRQFELIRKLNRDWSNVSVIFSQPAPEQIKELSACAKQYKIRLKAIVISDYINIIDALNSSLTESDVLLALPDSSVYNTRTIKSILLTTYRHRVPVIGFSESFVRAGALAAISSSPEQLGKQLAELIEKYNREQALGSHHIYPKYFDVITNKDVARSLEISIPDEQSLTQELRSHD